MGSALVAADRLRDVIPVDRAQRAAFDVSARAGGDVQETRWRGASRMLRGMESWVASTWASLPGAGYGQPEKAMADLVRVYHDALEVRR